MVTLEAFVECPSEELLIQCTKDQLLKIAETYNIKIESGDKKLKETLVAVLRKQLFEKDVSDEEPVERYTPSRLEATTVAPSFVMPVVSPGLSFEQHKELILLQAKLQADQEKVRLDTQFAIEKMRK